MFGNAGLNAIHALITVPRARSCPRDGRLPEPLRAGIAEPSAEEVAGWATPQARRRAARRVPASHRTTSGRRRSSIAARGLSLRRRSTASRPGKPILNTTLISTAHANFTLRLAPGQDPEEIAAAVRRADRGGGTRRRRDRADAGAAALDRASSIPKRRRSSSASTAFERAMGVRPLLVRVGGTMPVLACTRRSRRADDHDGLRADRVERPRAERADAGRVHPELGIDVVKELFVSLGDLAALTGSVPRRRVVRPPSADHRRDDVRSPGARPARTRRGSRSRTTRSA